MKCLNKQRGFTLIEMLVVVLIIGILGAIALPQYQRASLKSRFAALMPIGKSLADSNEAYYLEHGEYALDPQELPVQGRANYAGGTAINLVDGQDLSYVQVSNTQVPNAQYIVYQKHSNKLPGTTVCEAADEQADELCLSLGGTETSPATGAKWTAYLLSGTNSSVPGTCKVGTGTFQEGQAVGSHGSTCKAVCEEGDCETQLTGGQVYDTDYSQTTTVCSGGAYACAGTEFKGLRTRCNAMQENSCAGATFSGTNSVCSSSKAYGCAGSIFTGYDAACKGSVANACAGTTFSGRSYCAGRGNNACAGATIQAGAYCYPLENGGCNDAKYGEDPTSQSTGIGSCEDARGHCPNGVPIRGTWNATNGSYNYSWKGGYCDPNAMVSGKCPAGTHSADTSGVLDGQCWDGNGTRVDCE